MSLNIDLDNFSKHLNDAIKDRNLTKKDLAGFSGISVSTISRYCAGKTQPVIKNVEKLSKILSVPMEWLIGEDNEFILNENKRKKFLLDTSVLMRSPDGIFNFENNDILICEATLEELDTLKSRNDEKGYIARQIVRQISRIRGDSLTLNKGVLLPGGGVLTIISPTIPKSSFPDGWDRNKTDNLIIMSALQTNSILVTTDLAMLIKAESIGVHVENFRNEQVSDTTMNYSGRKELILPSPEIDKTYTYKSYKPTPLQKSELTTNEFVILRDENNEKHTALGYFQGGEVHLLNNKTKPYGVEPKNMGQRFALEALLKPASEVPLVILRGPAGTAKTFLSLAAGLHGVTETHEYKKMLILRPNIKFDEDIGYLKGDEMDKIKPLIRPCYDNLEALLCDEKDTSETTRGKIEYLFAKGWITAEALAYLRGRSIANTYILCDEAQNSTPQQIMGIISRAGLKSKIVIVGDPDQIDNPKLDAKNNGLVYAAERMRGSSLCMQLTFSESECVRSPLAREASQLLKI